MIWDESDKAIPMKTAPGRADGAADATNRSGLTVGYLGNLGTDGIPGVPTPTPRGTMPWSGSHAWQSRACWGAAPVHAFAELVDVNDRGQAAGMSGTFTNTGFPLSSRNLADWLEFSEAAPDPGGSTEKPGGGHPLNDINNRGDIVGNVYGLAAKDYCKLRRIDPVLWTCAFGG